MLQGLWLLDGSLGDFDEARIPLEESAGTSLGLSLSPNTLIPADPVIPSSPSEVTTSPQTPISPELSALTDLEYMSENQLPEYLDQLCAILRRHYSDSKPPGRLFKHFVYRKNDLNRCRLCPKALENREQIVQHVMKAHCNHFPFGCNEPGW